MNLPIKGWDEQDAFTRWRRVLTWQAGELAKIKRRYAKRTRRYGKEQIKKERGEG